MRTFLIDELSDNSAPDKSLKSMLHADHDASCEMPRQIITFPHKTEAIKEEHRLKYIPRYAQEYSYSTESMPSPKYNCENPFPGHHTERSPTTNVQERYYYDLYQHNQYPRAYPEVYELPPLHCLERPDSSQYEVPRLPPLRTYDTDDDDIVYVPVRKSSLNKGIHIKAPGDYPIPTIGKLSESSLTVTSVHSRETTIVDQSAFSHFSFRNTQQKPKGGRVEKKKENHAARMLPPKATETLKKWYASHTEHPYPSYEEKQQLIAVTSLSLHQINTWFVNRRCREKVKEKGA
jgi:hypothetical protein